MSQNSSRREFLKRASATLAVSSFGFPNVILPSRQQKLGVALTGLGYYSTDELAPGLQKTEHCELRGIVTGSPEKIPKWQKKYDIPDQNVYNYETLPEIANNDDIDIVYIVTPPGLHARDAIKAAEAGKHVWCEKPMAIDAEECQAIIDAADENGVQLTIGYRLQHERNTQTIMRYAEEEPYGAIKTVRTGAAFNGSFTDENAWRTDAELGGGCLYDMGVYPINAARYAAGMEPIAVSGRTWTEREEMFSEVPEYAEFELEFPEGVVAKGRTSFGESVNYLEVKCTDGWYELRPFQGYSGVQGKTSDGTELPPQPGDQQARQMDNDALAIKNNEAPLVPGQEGLADIRVVRGIMESDRKDGARIKL